MERGAGDTDFYAVTAGRRDALVQRNLVDAQAMAQSASTAR